MKAPQKSVNKNITCLEQSMKQVEESHKKLKQEHRELAHKYQELEFAYEAIDPSLENFVNETIEKVNASTSCDDLLINANATNIVPELAPSREKELMDQVASLKSSVEKLSRGEYIHKEILFNSARDYGKKSWSISGAKQRHHPISGDQD